MLKSLVGSPQVVALEQALAASSLRHRVISNNIANVNTPHFKRSDVDFTACLATALNKDNSLGEKLSMVATNERHIKSSQHQNLQPSIVTDATNSRRNDGNNVDIDIEMANMATNTLYYQSVAQMTNRYFANLRSAINEGRR